ncbi:glucose-1-phosphate adenylyltransferase subunit GlgD [Clostridium sp. B9]|uniref:glucose-1-phosphate adenylyltransferase subunit GlgD n=1 Tax=Clostridium sp. B9 TaxID=3423224 RepID=UPI003D2EC27E
MNNCIGIINLDENESRMGELVKNRPLAAVPIAGRYRVVDFILSNMTNAGIESLGILTKNKSRSLVDHLTNGRPWDLHRKRDGLRVFNFGEREPYYDDITNLYENLDFLTKSRREYVLIAPSYMICNIDLKEVLEFHKKNDNDVTVVYKHIDYADSDFIECDVLNLTSNGLIKSVGKNLGRDEEANISMEMYILRTDLLIEIIYECIRQGSHRKFKNYLNDSLDELKVGGFEFKGYLSCVNSLKAYYKANMDLLDEEVYKELFIENAPIYTKSRDEGPTHYTKNSNVTNSIIANGSYIEGKIENCIVGRRVYVGPDAVIKNCIIMQETVIGESAHLDKIITDKAAVVRDDEKIVGLDYCPMVLSKPNII